MTIGLNLSPAASAALSGADPNITDPKAAARFSKIKDTAQDFEAMFLNSMFQQMFAHVGEGPFSGGPGAKVWQSFLTDEYSKSFVRKGGIGLADQVQRELLARQEIQQVAR
jgi:peptidoglycan hydrolase FlgJ